MLLGKNVLAVVTARSGSKGIKHKNMRELGGVSLIGRAGQCLGALPWLDAAIISTDDAEYAREGERYGLKAPFLRPERLSSDTAGSVDTLVHALEESEKFFGKTFDVILIVEPTSPLRIPQDIENATRLLLESGADSVVAVSPLDPKFHPRKILSVDDGKLEFYQESGASVVARQSLSTFYWRNGVCYALTRECLLEKKKIFTENTLPLVIEREIVNIDEPLELDWAALLLEGAESRRRDLER
jgi:CMP-N,N'-diacetyllegionaminic acid synthase